MKTSLLSYLILFLLAPSFSFAQMDYSGFFRFRVSQFEEASIINQTMHLKGSLRSNEHIQTDFWIHSSNKGKKLDADARFYASSSLFITNNLVFSLGRSPIKDRFPLFFSSNLYELYPLAFDGGEIEYNSQTMLLNFWAGHFPSLLKGAREVKDGTYSLGVYGTLNMVSQFFNQVHWYFSYLQDSLSWRAHQTSSRYGLNIQGQIPLLGMRYSALGAMHAKGLQFASEETMYDFSLSYSLMDFGNSMLLFNYHRDTGNFDPFLYNRHETSGILDVLEWGNITYFYLAYQASFSRLFDIKLGAYHISATETGPMRLGLKGDTIFKTGISGTKNRPLAVEFDMEISRRVLENLEIHLMGGVFYLYNPRTYVYFEEKNRYSQVELSMLYKF